MVAYVIVQIEIEDAEKYEQYRAGVPATVEAHGGRYLVRGGRIDHLEGEAPLPRVAVLEFPSFEQAKAWYDSDDYADLKRLRQSASRANAILVEGV